MQIDFIPSSTDFTIGFVGRRLGDIYPHLYYHLSSVRQVYARIILIWQQNDSYQGATPIEDARAEERYGDASPMEEESEEAMPDASDRATPIEEDHRNESRAENVQSEQPQPVDNVVER